MSVFLNENKKYFNLLLNEFHLGLLYLSNDIKIQIFGPNLTEN